MEIASCIAAQLKYSLSLMVKWKPQRSPHDWLVMPFLKDLFLGSAAQYDSGVSAKEKLRLNLGNYERTSNNNRFNIISITVFMPSTLSVRIVHKYQARCPLIVHYHLPYKTLHHLRAWQPVRARPLVLPPRIHLSRSNKPSPLVSNGSWRKGVKGRTSSWKSATNWQTSLANSRVLRPLPECRQDLLLC